jgi:hypothetical protein
VAFGVPTAFRLLAFVLLAVALAGALLYLRNRRSRRQAQRGFPVLPAERLDDEHGVK